MANWECTGCEEKCETSWTSEPTGCMYEDGDHPKDAKIWEEK